MAERNLLVLLHRRPDGAVQEDDFRIIEGDIPVPGEGEVLLRSRWLSLDPYMRMRMDDTKSYAPPAELGQPMVGDTVGEVVESRHPDWKPGDKAVGRLGWQRYGVANASTLRRVEIGQAPLSYALGVLGMPGVTAWYGLMKIGEPKPGETVVVSAAAGAVGSVVGQVARILGCRAVGVAGGASKCAHVTGTLGFTACVDYRAPDFPTQLAASVPDAIDVYFENVGGRVLDTVLPLLNAHARIPFCGYISAYDRSDYGVRNLRALLTSRAALRGFIVGEHREWWPTALEQLGRWVATGALHYHETVTTGLHNAPAAFIGMLKGANLGKQLVLVD